MSCGTALTLKKYEAKQFAGLDLDIFYLQQEMFTIAAILKAGQFLFWSNITSQNC